MVAKPGHGWIVAPYQQDRQALWNTVKSDGPSYLLDCHRSLRGPYTGAGTLLRQLVPMVYERSPEHVDAHIVEILSLAPELSSFLSVSTKTLTTLAVPKERTRFYSRTRTLRLAHGIIDFLKGCISLGIFSSLSLYFENVHATSDLDQELIAALLRRSDPTSLQLTIGTTEQALPQTFQASLTAYAQRLPAQPLTKANYARQLRSWMLPERWQSWLLEHTQGWIGEWMPLCHARELLKSTEPVGDTLAEGMQCLVEQAPLETRKEWAKAFIASDGTSDVLLEQLAYQYFDDVTRQQWQDGRAAQLEAWEEWSLRLGAIPYHREHGTSPAEQGAAALRTALDYCLDMGYYEATVELGYRGRTIIDWKTQPNYYWIFTTKMTTSLAALGRPEEAEKLYNETRILAHDPLIHMQAAYATAMLYTRYYEGEHRNHHLAKAWMNQAIAIATLLPDPKDRSFNTVFNENGLALIEMHLGSPQEALRLVTEGLERLNHELKPDEHLLHRSVLLFNRAQIYASMGKLEEALADYTVVIEHDPYYSEYYFERGNLYRKLGRNEEALADYQRSITCSPPYPEAYYNRAGVLSVLGRENEALADYNYVLELDPDYLDALVNRSSLYYESGLYAESRQDIERGLQLDAHNAHMPCTLGLLEMAEEHPEEAYLAFSSAIEHDPSLVAAWTNRAILSFEQGETEAAIDDLTRALALEENATVFSNRGIAYQTLQKWPQAIEDFTQALKLGSEDEQDTVERLYFCRAQLENTGSELVILSGNMEK